MLLPLSSRTSVCYKQTATGTQPCPILTSAGNEVFHATARLLRRVNKKPGTGGPGFYPS